MNDNEQKIVFRMINIKLKDNISNFPFSISHLIFPSPNPSFINILTTWETPSKIEELFLNRKCNFIQQNISMQNAKVTGWKVIQ